MKQSDLESLSTKELKQLHNQIVRILNQRFNNERKQWLAHFRIGDKVEFKDYDGSIFSGIVERVNRKTLSIMTDSGQGFRVSPELVRHKNPVKIKTPQLNLLNQDLQK